LTSREIISFAARTPWHKVAFYSGDGQAKAYELKTRKHFSNFICF